MGTFEKLKILAEENDLILEKLDPPRGDVRYVVISNDLHCSDDCSTLKEVKESINDLSLLKEK